MSMLTSIDSLTQMCVLLIEDSVLARVFALGNIAQKAIWQKPDLLDDICPETTHLLNRKPNVTWSPPRTAKCQTYVAVGDGRIDGHRQFLGTLLTISLEWGFWINRKADCSCPCYAGDNRSPPSKTGNQFLVDRFRTQYNAYFHAEIH
jgi:hypothetical protein